VRRRGPRPRAHMHPLHYWPGTQKFLKPRTGQAAAPANRLASRSKLTKVERAPFWVYCSLLWVHVARRRRGAAPAAAACAPPPLPPPPSHPRTQSRQETFGSFDRLHKRFAAAAALNGHDHAPPAAAAAAPRTRGGGGVCECSFDSWLHEQDRRTPGSLYEISTRGVAKVNFLSIAQNGRRMCA
jgi:hypothetical protein